MVRWDHFVLPFNSKPIGHSTVVCTSKLRLGSTLWQFAFRLFLLTVAKIFWKPIFRGSFGSTRRVLLPHRACVTGAQATPFPLLTAFLLSLLFPRRRSAVHTPVAFFSARISESCASPRLTSCARIDEPFIGSFRHNRDIGRFFVILDYHTVIEGRMLLCYYGVTGDFFPPFTISLGLTTSIEQSMHFTHFFLQLCRCGLQSN